MLDVLSTVLAVFATVAASAVGWVLIAKSARTALKLGTELAADGKFMAGVCITGVLLVALILT